MTDTIVAVVLEKDGYKEYQMWYSVPGTPDAQVMQAIFMDDLAARIQAIYTQAKVTWEALPMDEAASLPMFDPAHWEALR